MARAYVGLGANLANPPLQLRQAIARLRQRPGIRQVKESSFYRSAPLGPQPQDDYCNAVCEIETTLDPRDLLAALKQIEDGMGRQRPAVRWAPRLIDLDLLHYEGIAASEPELTLPHPEIGHRNFVLVPLAEIAPALHIPGLGLASRLAVDTGSDGLSLWSPA